jgi:hypothetical protein
MNMKIMGEHEDVGWIWGYKDDGWVMRMMSEYEDDGWIWGW